MTNSSPFPLFFCFSPWSLDLHDSVLYILCFIFGGAPFVFPLALEMEALAVAGRNIGVLK